MPEYLVQSTTTAQTKRGKDYLRMTLYDTTGKLWKAVYWDLMTLKAANVIDALTELDSFGGEEQLTVKAMRVIAEKPTDDRFLPRSVVDTSTCLTELHGFVETVGNKSIASLLSKVLEDKRWLRGPAAMTMHHAHLGGLIEHTLSLCKLVNAVCQVYPKLRRDLLLFAAIMHDVGKLDELNYVDNISYSDEGQLLGHILISLRKLDDNAEACGINGQLLMMLSHIIISHHGNVSYGSPKSPQIIEAVVFSALDGLDANMGSIAQALNKCGDKPWTDKTSTGQAMYLGKID